MTAPVLQLDLRIAMSDGVVLAGLLARPPGEGRFPTLMTFTPYGVDYGVANALRHAAAGFAYVIVECRGRGESGGAFEVYDDAEDGAEAIAWAASQSWSTGRVALRGGSYAGLTQWSVAARRPDALAGIAPLVAPMPGFDSDAWCGIVPLYNVRWAAFVSGRAARPSLFGVDGYWRDRFAAHTRSGAPTRALAAPLVEGDTILETIMTPPWPASFWDFARPTQRQFAAIDAPCLSISGTADSALRGAIRYFEEHDAVAAEGVRRHLVIGPWNHSGARVPHRFDGEGAGEDPLADPKWCDQLEIDWHRYVLEGAPVPAFLTDRVAVFVAGAEEWRKGHSIAALANDHITMYLDPASKACDVDEPGVLAPTVGAGTCAFTYDPMDFRFAELEAEGRVGDLFFTASGDFPFENGFVRYLFGQGVVFESAPLEAPATLLGVPDLTLSLSVNVEDTDLMFALQALLPDGSVLNLSMDFLRLRHRDPDDPIRLMRPGEIENVRFRTARIVARRLPCGARLRLVIRSPASIYLERHRNSGKPVAEQTMADARTAHITIHAAQSRLVVPIAVSAN